MFLEYGDAMDPDRLHDEFMLIFWKLLKNQPAQIIWLYNPVENKEFAVWHWGRYATTH